jgi:hypothetical protein
MVGNHFTRSLSVAKESYSVLKSNPSLAFFPAISGIAVCLASAPFVIAIFLTAQGSQHLHSATHAMNALQYFLSGALYFVDMFLVIFFNSALVACVNEVLQGRQATVGFGFKIALSRLPQIIGWSLIASTVGIVLRAIGKRSGIVGTIVISLIGLAWNLVVFFVVPVLVIEKVGPIAAIKTSGHMLKKTWGERIILGVGISTVLFVLGLGCLVPIGLAIGTFSVGIFPLAIFFVICAAMYLLVLATIGTALGNIYQTALYLYSRDGTVGAGFSSVNLQGAFQPKPERKFFGRSL